MAPPCDGPLGMIVEPVRIAGPPADSSGHPLPSPKSVTSGGFQPDRGDVLEVQGVPPADRGEGQGAPLRGDRRGTTRGHAPGHPRVVWARRLVRHASVTRCKRSPRGPGSGKEVPMPCAITFVLLALGWNGPDSGPNPPPRPTNRSTR